MTSEAIEESGVNVFICALALGSGTGRRFDSEPFEVYERSSIGELERGRRTAAAHFRKKPVYSSFTMPLKQGVSQRRFACYVSRAGCTTGVRISVHPSRQA